MKADQAQTADTPTDVNLRGMTALILVQKTPKTANQRQWN